VTKERLKQMSREELLKLLENRMLDLARMSAELVRYESNLYIPRLLKSPEYVEGLRRRKKTLEKKIKIIEEVLEEVE